MRLRVFGLTALLVALTPAVATAQFIGGGTPDMHNGARGIDQPSFNEGQRVVAPEATASDAADAAPAPAPTAAPLKAKKKHSAKRRPAKAKTAPPAATAPVQ